MRNRICGRSLLGGAILASIMLVACGGGGNGSNDPAPAAQETTSEDEFAPPPLEEPKDCPNPATKLEVSSTEGASWAGENGKPVAALEACLVAPAGKPFSITLHNQSDTKDSFVSLEHNVSIYTDVSALETIMKGEFVKPGKSLTYDVDPMDPGLYLFRCDLHVSNMKGVLVVE